MPVWMKKRGWGSVGVLILASLAAWQLGVTRPAMAASLDEVTMCTVPFAPLYGQDLPREGFVTALTRAAFNAVAVHTQLSFMPWARAMKEVRLGHCDMLMGGYYTDERAGHYYTSHPLYIVRVGFVARKDLPIDHFDSIKDLKPYTIGVTRHYANSPEFDKADFLHKEVANTPVLNVRKLYAGRLDMVSIAFPRFRFIAAKNDLDLDKIKFLKPSLKRNAIVMLVSHNIPNGKVIIAKFNKGLRKIQVNGVYSRILKDMGY